MDLYTYRVTVLTAPADTEAAGLPDLEGYEVEATDGHVGKVDAATYDADASCLVVDTGFWIFGTKRMIPAGVVRSIDTEENKVHLDLTKDQIKGAPDYDAARHDAGASAYRREVGDYYARNSRAS